MNAFIEFLREYWFQLLTALAFVLEIIFIFIKRKPKSIDDFKLALSEALSCVPELVISRERPGEGSSKKAEVLLSIRRYISSKLGRDLTVSEEAMITAQAAEKIETVLSTPTKKEKINEK